MTMSRVQHVIRKLETLSQNSNQTDFNFNFSQNGKQTTPVQKSNREKCLKLDIHTIFISGDISQHDRRVTFPRRQC